MKAILAQSILILGLVYGAAEQTNETPIWFSRLPNTTHTDEHQLNYLLCKQAHSGQTRWIQRLSGACHKCFCLADTQRIGCTLCSDYERHVLSKRNSESMEKRKGRAASIGVYVNHEACVRANLGRTFTRGDRHCVCRQNGSISCVPIVSARH
ncbi:hypothetical protein BX667DRAFT_497628 [Coemansia mojavensis]|nr:hypothetical protein BX667DRAFT_497628 [Coemansia mojavensis]